MRRNVRYSCHNDSFHAERIECVHHFAQIHKSLHIEVHFTFYYFIFIIIICLIVYVWLLVLFGNLLMGTCTRSGSQKKFAEEKLHDDAQKYLYMCVISVGARQNIAENYYWWLYIFMSGWYIWVSKKRYIRYIIISKTGCIKFAIYPIKYI